MKILRMKRQHFYKVVEYILLLSECTITVNPSTSKSLGSFSPKPLTNSSLDTTPDTVAQRHWQIQKTVPHLTSNPVHQVKEADIVNNTQLHSS